MSSLVDIAKGWYHFVAATPSVKKLMETRLAICDGCEEKEQLSELGVAIVTGINSAASTYRCGRCHCPLAAKGSNPKEKCPLGKW